MDTTELYEGALDLSAKDGVAAMQKMLEGRKWFISFLDSMVKILEVEPDSCWQTNKSVAFYLRQLAKEMEIHCETLSELIATGPKGQSPDLVDNPAAADAGQK